MAFTEGEYPPNVRRRNRLVVGGLALAGVTACTITAAASSWPWANAFASAGILMLFCAALWWMFASANAGPVGLSPRTKSWFRDVASPYRRVR